MDNRYYYFYDLNEVLIDRYPSKIANEIKKIEFNSRFVFIYSENTIMEESLKIFLRVV